MRAATTTRFIPMALVGLALLVAACGGGGGTTGAGTDVPAGTDAPVATDAPAGQPTEAAAAGEIDACSLLSAADVEAVIGEAPEAGIDQGSGDLFACSWQGATTPTELVTISVYAHPDADTAREQYGFVTEGLEGVDILGLADEAWYTEAIGLQALSGRYVIAIDNTGDDRKMSSLALAQQILPQLP